MVRVSMDVQHSSLEVHEDKLHTHEYADSRAEITGKRHKSISLATERGAGDVMEPRGQDLGRFQSRIFHDESHFDHDGARLSQLRICLRPGVPQTLRMHKVHG